MNYPYKINNQIYNVERSHGQNYVIVYERRGRGVDCDIVKDNSGQEYFNYKGVDVYINDWIRLSYENFQSLMDPDNNQYVFSDQLIAMILTEGIDKVIFTVPMNTLTTVVEKHCVINESRYKVIDDYKIELEVCDDDFDGSTAVSTIYYTSDLINFIKSGIISVKVS